MAVKNKEKSILSLECLLVPIGIRHTENPVLELILCGKKKKEKFVKLLLLSFYPKMLNKFRI